MKKNAVLVVSAALLLTMVLANTLLAEHEHKGKPLNAEIMQKTQKLQMPFVANEGQLDERVAFYARTFGGTVFVTKDGDIVYSLPGVAHAPPLVHNEINKGKTGYTGLTGHVGEEGTCMVPHALCTIFPFCTGNFPVHYAETNAFMCHTKSNSVVCHSGRSEASHGNNSPSTRRDTALRIPATQSTAVALKEEFIGAKISGVKGEGESVTKVSYFKGNDSSKWKSNIFTYELVNLGEIYDGVELKLKAHGNNVEKLFCVKPGADPSQIKISVSGVQSSGNPPPTPASGGQSSVPLTEGDKGGGTAVNPQNQHRIGTVQKSRHHVIAKEERLKQSPDSHSNAGIDCFANARNDRENQPFLTDSHRGLWVNEHGELVAETELGPVKFTKPIAYQMIDGKRVEVDCKYVIRDREEKDTPLRAGSGFQPEPLNLLNTGVCAGNTISKGINTGVQVANLNLQEGPLQGGDSGVGKSAIQGLKSTNSNFKSPKSKIENRQSEYGFTVASYDCTKDLVIDPLLASTYLGGSVFDVAYSLTIDTSGNVYVAGVTESTDFPTTGGAYDTAYNGGNDVFISKLDSGLTSLLAFTYLGGSGYEYSSNGHGHALALDTSGNVYVTGYTGSSDFPTTSGAYDTSWNGADADVFVSKLDSGLTSLLASTYLGGFGYDYGHSLALDTGGNVYVAGRTGSSDFPTTSSAYDTSYDGIYGDIFVSKLNSGLTSLLASTYLGGSYWDLGFSLIFDTDGNVYVTGHTGSSDFPTTSGAYDTSQNGTGDVFVSKLNGGLTSLLASTYLGGSSGGEEGVSLTIDTSGNVYVAGVTESTDFPTTGGAYDTSYNGGPFTDAFVSKLDGGLTSLFASTYLGGSSTDLGFSLTLNTSGNVYVMGLTSSSDFPTTSGAYDNSYNGDPSNVFVSKLDGGLTSMLASTYLGESNTEGFSLTLDTSGNVYVLGSTNSTDFPTTSGAYDTSFNGDVDVFVSKLDGNLSASTATTPTPSPTPSPTASPKPTPTPTITPKVDSLLEKYAPILYMHGQERFHPTNVKVMLDNSELYKKKIGKDKIVYENIDNTLTLDMLMSDKYNTKKHYLKLKKDAEEAAKDKDIYWYWKKEQTVYGRKFTSKEDKSKTVLQYWFFYVYNDWGTTLYSGNSHEGDWEMIQIILNNNKNDQPERITYGFHHGGQTFEWDREEVSKSVDGNHPLVYVTLGGHGCWNISGNNAWYQDLFIEECRECIDETSDDGDVLYPSTMSSSEIQAIADKYSYKLEDLSNASTSNWIYWKGYWGNQEDPKDIIITDFGSSGPPSPPYIDYIKKSKYPRWKFPVKWADFPLPSNYTVCASDNSKVIISDLEGNSVSYNEYCSADSDRCGKECSNLKITYSEKDLIFDVYSLDGKEVNLKISRHKRRGGIYEVEFNNLEIPRNGKASFTFSPEQNPSLEIGIDSDMDGLFDSHRLPDYFEIK